MGGGSSRSSQSSTQNVYQTSENLNVQDVEGITVAGAEGDVRIVQTDHNAVGSATRLAERSVQAAENINADSLDFARRVFDTGIGAMSEGFETYADNLGGGYADAYGGAAAAVESAQDAGYDFAGAALAFVRDAVQTTQDTIGESVGAILSIGKEQNTSADQRVSELSAQGQKNMLILVAIVGVAFLGFAIYKGR